MTDASAAETRLKNELERLQAEVEALKVRAESAEALADRDVLTPTLNRRGFVREISRVMALCRRHNENATLLYLDLDGFKAINDTYGHPAGDQALVRTAEIMLQNLRESDALGRLGGDEFAVLLYGADQKAGQEKAQSLHDSLVEQGFTWEEVQVPIRGSFGARTFKDHDSAEAWLAEADAAMWVRKRENGNRR